MKTSATDNDWETKSEDITAQILAKRVKKEAHLKEIVGQSAFSFFIGNSVLSGVLRIAGLLAIGFFYFRIEASSSLCVWPIFTLGAFVEACRANRRLDALLELERIAQENNQTDKPSHPTANNVSI
jgi:hypothetical protein